MGWLLEIAWGIRRNGNSIQRYATRDLERSLIIFRDGNSRAGRISDDTQMTFWTVERLLSTERFQFDDLVRCFVDRQSQIVGRGKNTTASLAVTNSVLASGGIAMEACAGDPKFEGRGNGGLMRFSPVVLPHLRSPSAALYSDAVLATLITHGNAWALASIVPMTHLLWSCLANRTGAVPRDQWWIDEYIRVGADLEVGACPSRWIPILCLLGIRDFEAVCAIFLMGLFETRIGAVCRCAMPVH